jgi:hypothetical protein
MHRILAIALGALVTSACTGVIGDGKAVQEPRQLTGFTRVSTSGGIAVDVTAGADFRVVVDCECNILPYLKTEVVGDELRIGTADKTTLWPTRPMRVIVSLPTLAGLTTSGGAKAQAKGIDSPALTLVASGGGEMTLAGKTASLDADASGGAHLFLKDLASESAHLVVSGGAQIDAEVTVSAEVEASGGAKVTVAGGGAVQQSVSGGASVTVEQ